MDSKPFIKYVGGKRKLLPKLLEHFPDNIINYYEPFVGGGSVVLELINKNLITGKICISDVNTVLIDSYLIVRDNADALIVELKKADIYKNDKESYLKNRLRYNDIKSSNDNVLLIEKVALFIYLNKCGFNGMYRENSSGKFNIPFGKQNNPTIADEALLKVVSKALNENKIDIICGNYSDIKDNVKKGDFVYIDSPYDDTFTDYTSSKFGKKEQLELKTFVDTLTELGVNVMLSNSATDFIKDLYKDYTQFIVDTKYFVNSKAENRGDIKQEVIIVNYKKVFWRIW